MIVILLDWLGASVIIIGSFIIALKIAYKPKVRLFALSFYLMSNIVWIPFAIKIEKYGLLLTQIILFFINSKGIINCFIDIRRLENISNSFNDNGKVFEEIDRLRHSYGSNIIIINEKIIMDKNHYKDIRKFARIMKWE